ncbi:MAG: putative membrane protein [Candidatus Woesebacteria bacterium GW2011_GWB1_39_12]|uniref:Putative membrane protein n=1 Tax=Candidatus Woesebacteria bacterium GW2011_GWB1_39_12 TaxID=1618574 RepID=A0A0G0M9D3_9BACT|nr:MAG: putative membrane protein [Candidatus Woesebacteria bacterium GW2011_GWB1_39_12]
MAPKRVKAYIYLLLAALIWGIAGPVIKFTLDGIDPLPFISYRLAISAVISIIFFILKIKKGKKFRQLRVHLPLVFLYGFLAVPAALGLLFAGLDNGAAFFSEHITKRERIGVSIVLLGVLLNSLYPIIKAEGVKLTANILLFAYLLADSGSILIAKKLSRFKINSANLTNLAFIIGAITLLPLTLVSYGWENFFSQIVNLPLKYHLGVWYMAIFSGSIAYYLFVRAHKSIEVSEAVLFNYLQPVITIPLAIFWLHESISPSFITGAILITIGLIIAEYKKKRYNT